MAGLLIIAHAPLATALRACVEHVYGSLPIPMGAIDVLPGDDPVGVRQRALQDIQGLNTGHGMLVLTDMVGATPGNIAQSLLATDVAVVAGVNVPMLVRAVCYRDLPLVMVREKALMGGTQGVQSVDGSLPLNPCALMSASRLAMDKINAGVEI